MYPPIDSLPDHVHHLYLIRMEVLRPAQHSITIAILLPHRARGKSSELQVYCTQLRMSGHSPARRADIPSHPNATESHTSVHPLT